MIQSTTSTLSPVRLLEALDAYRGSIVDVDDQRCVDADTLARGRRTLLSDLQRAGLESGDRVVVAVGNGSRFLAAMSATLEADSSPLFVHVDTPVAELRRTALRFGARFLITDAKSPDALASATATSQRVGEGGFEFVWSRWDDSDPDFVATYPPLPGIPLHPTSGTTGLPKLAVRPAEAAIADAESYVTWLDIDSARDTVLSVAPMSHAFTFGLGVIVPMITGANLVAMRKFNPRTVLRVLREQPVTILPMAPAMIDILCFAARDKIESSLRVAVAGGAPLPRRIAELFHEKTGAVVRPGYGTTETGAIAGGMGDEVACDSEAGGFAGQPLHRMVLDVMPATDSDGDTEPGTLRVQSPAMMTGYLTDGRLDTTAVDDGWFRTGDLATIDADGTLHLQGRRSDLINCFGLKVIPIEVEEVLASLPGVIEAKVYPGDHASGSQIVKAAVVAQPTLDTASIRQHCSQHLAAHKCPEIITLVDALPRSPTGKIIADQLP